MTKNNITRWILVLLTAIVSLAGTVVWAYTVLLDPSALSGNHKVAAPKAPVSAEGTAAGNFSAAPTSADQSVDSSRRATMKTRARQIPDGPSNSPSYASDKRSTFATYAVEPGDTLYQIARRYRSYNDIGLSRMVMAIFRANPGAFLQGNINSLKIGAKLRIPNRRNTVLTSEEVVVQSYETLPERENRSLREAGTQSQEKSPKRVAAAQPDQHRSPRAPGTQSQAELQKRRREAEQRALNIFLRNLAVIYPAGQLQLEANILYSSDRVTNFRIGNRVIPRQTTRSANISFTGRYGLTDRLQLIFTIPFDYTELEHDFTIFPEDGSQVRRADTLGLGDISAGLTYQLFNERGARPAVALGLGAKSDTGDELLGTGRWNVSGQINMVKTIDPVVFFGGVGYVKTLEQDGIDPGDQYLYQFGTGFSLNDRVSLDIQAFGATVRRTELNGEEISGSGLDAISLQFGATALVGNNLFIEPTVSAGLTDDAPDAAVGIDLVYQIQRLFPLPFLHQAD